MKLKIALALFDGHELVELGQVLKSGILGNTPGIADCFEECRKLREENLDWTEIDLSRRMFPNGDPTQNKNYLRTRTSALMRCIEQYLAWKEFQKDHLLQGYCIVHAFHGRGWENEFKSTYQHAIKIIEDAPLKGFAHFGTQLRLLDDMHLSEGTKPNRKTMLSYSDSMLALDKAYMIKKLSLAAKNVSQNRIRLADVAPMSPAQIQGWIELNQISDDPLVQLFFEVYQLVYAISPETDPRYFNVKQNFFDQAEKLVQSSLVEAQDIFTHLINYAVLRYNQKELKFLDELATLYKTAFSTKILLEEGMARSNDVINAFLSFLNATRQDDARTLLKAYGYKIKGEMGHATRHFCAGCLDFHNGAYVSAYEHFEDALNSPPKQKAPQFETDLRANTLKSIYMMGEYREVIRFANQFEVLMRTIALSPARISAIKQFIQLTRWLSEASIAKGNKRQQRIQKLNSRIAASNSPIFSSLWLKTQVEKLHAKE